MSMFPAGATLDGKLRRRNHDHHRSFPPFRDAGRGRICMTGEITLPGPRAACWRHQGKNPLAGVAYALRNVIIPRQNSRILRKFQKTCSEK